MSIYARFNESTYFWRLIWFSGSANYWQHSTRTSCFISTINILVTKSVLFFHNSFSSAESYYYDLTVQEIHFFLYMNFERTDERRLDVVHSTADRNLCPQRLQPSVFRADIPIWRTPSHDRRHDHFRAFFFPSFCSSNGNLVQHGTIFRGV